MVAQMIPPKTEIMDDFYTHLAPNVFFSKEPDAVINYMRDNKLLAQSCTCPTCESLMELVSRPVSATTDGFGWRCNNQRCTKRRTFITIRTGSFFEKSRIKLDKWLFTIYLWSQGSKVKTVQQQTNISEKTVIQMFQYLRDICSTKLLNTPVQLGAPGVVVQIDQSDQSKYNRKFKEMKGVSSNRLPSYLDERMWRDRWGSSDSDSYRNIIAHIAEQYKV